eukprot:TRINITY_DN543_c0_g2_i1.p1 TRINITY_DN543_c0_g2~~TRINITY_DN543_c0_g2_i1.p1  ORF type:complete len:1020 (+),score=301.28 TRINITY_DN543_c0_g2_i1:113-3061(+)
MVRVGSYRSKPRGPIHSADDEEAPLLANTVSVRKDSTTLCAARKLNLVATSAVCLTVFAVLCYLHYSHFEENTSQTHAEQIAKLKVRLADAERRLSRVGADRMCEEGTCVKDLLPPIASPALEEEIEINVLPARWNIMFDPERSYWLWVIAVVGFLSALLFTGALLEATGAKAGKEESWFQTKAREVFARVRATDTFKQMNFYNPWNDPGQEPGEGNAYRLIAIVGPDICHVTQGGRKKYGADLTHGGFEFTVPTKGAYTIMLCVTMCLLTMQVYFPFQLIYQALGPHAHFSLVGLKKVAYYVNFPERVWLQLVPLLLMSCKFFVVVERALRDEFNQCLWIWHHARDKGFKYQIFGKYWTMFWTAVSLVVNFYIGIVMTFYVVFSISTFDSLHGDLMDFILGIFGSLGLLNFDDALMEALPLWAGWYKQHMVAAGHPQGEHPDGECADEFFGPEGVKGTGDGKDVVRWGERCHPEGGKQSDDAEASHSKPLKTKFVTVGIQLSKENPNLGFYYSGNKITMVSTSGAAAWAVDFDEVRNGVVRHSDLVVGVPARSSISSIGLTFYPLHEGEKDDPEGELSMHVKDAQGFAFAAGVRKNMKLVEVDDHHVRRMDDFVFDRLREGCMLRFTSKFRIWDPYTQGAVKGAVFPPQPLGQSERAPYLYKGRDCTEKCYWKYLNKIVKDQDAQDGTTLPGLVWPPTSPALKMLWHHAVEKWQRQHKPDIVLETKKGSTFRETFGISIDVDTHGGLRVVAIVEGGLAHKQGLPYDSTIQIKEFHVLSAGDDQVPDSPTRRNKAAGTRTWPEDKPRAKNNAHSLYEAFAKVPKGGRVSLIFEHTKYLRKPDHTGLEPGMQIWKINEEKVSNASDISKALRKLRGDSLKYPACDVDVSKAPTDKDKVGWTGGLVTLRGKNGEALHAEQERQRGGNYAEFTMTMTRAADEDCTLDDLVHGLIYATVRVLLFSSLIFILATYYIDTKTGGHVGI